MAIASKGEIERALNAWWEYIDKKIELNPAISRGISPKLIYDDSGRTIKLSLVDHIAPELSGLAGLVDAEYPHVYVEGTRNTDIYVLFHEVYEHEKHPSTGNPMPFTNDPKNLFLDYLKSHNIEPVSFLLYIYSDKGHDVYGKAFENLTAKELLFLTSDDGPNAYSLAGGHYAFRLNPLRNSYALPPQVRTPLTFYHAKNPRFSPATSTEVGIVYESFKDAISRL